MLDSYYYTIMFAFLQKFTIYPFYQIITIYSNFQMLRYLCQLSLTFTEQCWKHISTQTSFIIAEFGCDRSRKGQEYLTFSIYWCPLYVRCSSYPFIEVNLTVTLGCIIILSLPKIKLRSNENNQFVQGLTTETLKSIISFKYFLN